MGKHKLISEVVDQNICIGCGVCAGVCPGKNIIMAWSEYGELNPHIENACAPEACVCIEACPILNPFGENSAVIDFTNVKKENEFYDVIGEYISCYGGYSTKGEQRGQGSSGGVLTWLLTELLEEKKIDAAIVVVEGSNPADRLFEFKLLETREQIEAASGSKYYPVEISDVMQFLRKDRSDKSYALVGLPCLITGVAQAKKLYKRLDKKIKYTFSLTCGQLPNKFYTEALATYSGISIENLIHANYRSKKNTENARNFVFRARDDKGNQGKPLYWSTKPWYLWKNSFFIHGACKVCDDVFGRNADVVFMDAWLKQYSDDAQGHSFITVKNKELETFFQEKIQNSKIHLSPVEMGDIFKSQQGVIAKKTKNLSAHLYKLQQDGVRVTRRAVLADKNNYNEMRERIDLEWHVMQKSKSKWKELKDKKQEEVFFNDLREIDIAIQTVERKEKIREKMNKLKRNPFKTIQNILMHQFKKIYRK